VPEVLISGHHAKIISFRQRAALLLTYHRRPELLTAEQRQEAERGLRQLQQEGTDHARVD
jgi:tRNA (guanine37-N1)-methyltransferase